METMHLIKKTMVTVKQEGLKNCARKIRKYTKKKIGNKKSLNIYKDVLFISGCNEDLPHPWRYRVKHQREQLEAYNFTTGEIYFTEITQDFLRYYQMFVFFRCPETQEISAFIDQAKKLNKTVIYDIDDLVVDTKYTDTIKYVSEMKKEDKEAYDENVRKMQSLLRKCDFAITTTICLQDELRQYLSKVYINRNVASEEMVRLSKSALQKAKKDTSKIKIGYFSGSITHNADFDLILTAVSRIMERHAEVELFLAGELDLPGELKQFQDRVKKIPFMDWKKLPDMIAEMDINIAPLEDTVFNCAKSENKWLEAALVKVVTIASDVGAFHDCIENGRTGVLCSNKADWEEGLEKLITDAEFRRKIGEEAFRKCISECTTVKSGFRLCEIIRRESTETVAFVLPGLAISGGVRVALKHAVMLQKAGKQVLLLCLEADEPWYQYEDCMFPVIDLSKTQIQGKIKHMVATMWSTVKIVEQCVYAEDKCYLVQNYETDFYQEGDPLRIQANQSYMPNADMRFLTISRWCQEWLGKKYGKKSEYVPNGIDVDKFSYHRRKMEGKIRILIEGDCGVDYKNVDEAFEVTNGLNPERYEIWYMSYSAQPKPIYKVDRFFHKVPYDQVPKIYEQCDILLKTSLLESFSYPPLEMMATGGYVIAVPNGGNQEYLQNGENCLLYNAGDIPTARKLIYDLQNDTVLQGRLYEEGIKTVRSRNWENIQEQILTMYCGNLDM